MVAPADNLPTAVYSAAQVRELDRRAIEDCSIPGYELMRRAGASALESLLRRWPRARRVAILCGAGNNAGDGYVLARLAQRAGLLVRVFALTDPHGLRGNAATAWDDYRAAGGILAADAVGQLDSIDVVVDALLGTGLDRPLEGRFADAVTRINASRRPVLALDIPTGLDADTGAVHGTAVQATATVTFVGLKQGLFVGCGPDCCGQLEFGGLGIPAELAMRLVPRLLRLGRAELETVLPRRPRTQHKGASGRLLLVGGAPGTSGAIRLAGEAALRAGAGLVYVATHPESAAAVVAGRPELMCRSVRAPEELEPLLELVDAVVVGPGLGRDAWGRSLWGAVLASGRPLIVDADGLNLLALEPVARGNWILTPHPGEAARLLDCRVGEVQGARRSAVLELARRYAGIAVLKGCGTLVAAHGAADVWLCDRGNPGMATAGMGDVLSGVLGALQAQSQDGFATAKAGVLLHALAGDDAARDGERGTLAGDLLPFIRRWANPC